MAFLVPPVVEAIATTLSIPEPIVSKTGKHHPSTTHTGLPIPEVPSPSVPSHKHGYHYQAVDHVGATTLWVIWALFAVSFVVIALMAQRVERKLRLFHWISLIIVGTAMISYLCMAAGLGVTYVKSFSHAHTFRQVFWARYVDWAITTPFLILDLALLAGLPLTTTVIAMVADEAMILVGLFSGLAQNNETTRWLFFAVSDVFFLYVLYVLLVPGRAAAQLQSSKINSLYNGTMGLTVLVWLAYPIVFALTEGKGMVSADTEVILYGVMDVVAKIVFSFYLLTVHSHSEGDSVVISDFWTEPRGAARGYGAISQDD